MAPRIPWWFPPVVRPCSRAARSARLDLRILEILKVNIRPNMVLVTLTVIFGLRGCATRLRILVIRKVGCTFC